MLTIYKAEDLQAPTTRATIALPDPYSAEPPRTITDAEREFKAFRTLRIARANKRHEGIRKARAAKASENIMFYCLSLNYIFSRKKKRKPPRRSKQFLLHLALFYAFRVYPCFALLASQNLCGHHDKYDPFPWSINSVLHTSKLCGYLPEGYVRRK